MNCVHIHAPAGEYIGQVRRRGAQRWRTVANSKTAKRAMVVAIGAMRDDDKRARVLFCTEWYDPNVVMELSR